MLISSHTMLKCLLVTACIGAGDNMLELYTHMQEQANPLLDKPASGALSAVAQTYAERHDWPAAMAIAHDIASTRPDAAAELIGRILHGLQASGSNAGHAASGMPILHRTARSAHVVQVGAVRFTATARAETWPTVPSPMCCADGLLLLRGCALCMPNGANSFRLLQQHCHSA